MVADHAERTPRGVALVIPTHFDASSVIAGAERYAFELGRALARRVPTNLITFGNENQVREYGPLRVEYHRALCYVGGTVNPVSFRFLGSLSAVDVIHCLQVRTIVTEVAALYGRWRGKRVFVTDLAGGVRYNLTSILPVWRGLAGALAVSEFNRRGHPEWPANTRVIYSGVDTERFAPDGRGGRARVLFVGRLLPFKGVDVLIQAVDGLAPLDVVGQPYDAQYAARLEGLAHGKPVTFHRAMSDDELIRAYQAARLTAIPSLVEGGLTTAVESMACGTPVVATRVGSMPELVEDGETGFLVPPDDPPALRERIVHLLEHPEVAAAMGRAGRARVLERFTWDAVADRCLAAYRAAMTER